MRTISIRIDSELYAKFAEVCFRRQEKYSDVIRRCIIQHVNENTELIGAAGSRPAVKAGPVTSDPNKIFDKIMNFVPAGDKETVWRILASMVLEPTSKDYRIERGILERHGIRLTKDGKLAIANKHPILISKIGFVKYHEALQRHNATITKSYVVRMANKTTRATIFGPGRVEIYLKMRRDREFETDNAEERRAADLNKLNNIFRKPGDK